MSDKIKEFVNFSALKYASKTYMNPKKGDLAYCKDEDTKYGFNGKEWEKLVPVGDQQVAAMSNYEANQQIISQLPPITAKEQQECVNAINIYEKQKSNSYYMLLCKEYSYYTVLIWNSNEHDFSSLGEGVLLLLTELGTLRTYQVNNDDIELWVTINEETMCFHLFGYDLGVVTYG